ncbi:MAG: hypothetical protein GFH27_549313n16 [Chloroflexi bacterium AL-W]|nr:hypothetical protein [Chloroflexi bacterium AL-N1]NOK69439.1 hypothetical protein [Chloroflexi bacterium AL-N10]NOK77404.1 hypothetical protein [Chloroflexi bacterium AL-N5]NOK84255.1 hypothetical protein [Chloroflexi bacterium AL-W]NOK91580.1 hypothetical protein [Chloroflexi bacterium AL-N15]
MDFKELKHTWEQFGRIDPLWSIVTAPDKIGGKWDTREFFDSGKAQIQSLMEDVQSLDTPIRFGTCLDFGCGVGRLTQGLCLYFAQCSGVDVSPSMIKLANKYNRYPDTCWYYVNEKPDLSLFADNSFDFVYSILVLQHMRPDYSKAYIREFLRVVKPGGMIVFQIPSETITNEANSNYRNDLPETGLRAAVSIEEKFDRISPGEEKALLLKIKNESDVIWPAESLPNGTSHVRVGNHWLAPSGEVVINDDGRVRLPKDIAPQEACHVRLKVRGPAKPGNYLLEIDLVQEGNTWFKDKGSQTVTTQVQNRNKHILQPVQRMLKTINQKKVPHYPVMEMYCVTKDDIVALVEANKGAVLDIRKDSNCGDNWLSFTYFVTKTE